MAEAGPGARRLTPAGPTTGAAHPSRPGAREPRLASRAAQALLKRFSRSSSFLAISGSIGFAGAFPLTAGAGAVSGIPKRSARRLRFSSSSGVMPAAATLPLPPPPPEAASSPLKRSARAAIFSAFVVCPPQKKKAPPQPVAPPAAQAHERGPARRLVGTSVRALDVESHLGGHLAGEGRLTLAALGSIGRPNLAARAALRSSSVISSGFFSVSSAAASSAAAAFSSPTAVAAAAPPSGAAAFGAAAAGAAAAAAGFASAAGAAAAAGSESAAARRCSRVVNQHRCRFRDGGGNMHPSRL